MTIVLIGPMYVGKSTVARLLAERLRLDRRGLDKKRWAYYEEIGYDAEHVRRLAEGGRRDEVLKYWKPFEVHAVERHLEECRAQGGDSVVDFGAGYTVQEDPALFERVRRALEPFPFVVLLLPCADDARSIEFLKERIPQEFREFNERYVAHPANRALAKAIVYTMGRTPEQTCEDVLAALGLTVTEPAEAARDL